MITSVVGVQEIVAAKNRAARCRSYIDEYT